jgi:diguanylate cyclase (GGDEF)-like protein
MGAASAQASPPADRAATRQPPAASSTRSSHAAPAVHAVRAAPSAAQAAPADGAQADPKRTAGDAPGPVDVALADWSLLMSAVKSRLHRLADGPRADPPSPLAQAQLTESLHDCVSALDQLQATLVRELARRPRLELEVFDLQTGLSQARAELAGTRAGELQARHLALHDGLTALPNRRHFRDRLDLALGRQRVEPSALAVFFLDLDDFKQVNDRHGHAVGDDLLRIVATRLAHTLRAEDMVCRWGGDEFAGLLLGDIAPPTLAQLAGKLIDAVSAPMRIGPLTLRIRPSIGLAVAPADGSTAALLLQHADAAMYRAKRGGGGHGFHPPAPGLGAGPHDT